MIMSASPDSLNDVQDANPVRIFLPIKGNKERYRVCGAYQKTEPPRFNLLFQPGVLPVDCLDPTQSCLIVIDRDGSDIFLEAMISSVAGQTLAMIVSESISYYLMREFFRVGAATPVISTSFQPDLLGNNEASWSMQGKTVDISGSGILASFQQKPPLEEPIRLEITLPTNPPQVVKVRAHPVRAAQIDDDRWEVAFHFADISIEDRDKIISCCLVIQRRLLRPNVQARVLAS